MIYNISFATPYHGKSETARLLPVEDFNNKEIFVWRNLLSYWFQYNYTIRAYLNFTRLLPPINNVHDILRWIYVYGCIQ